jgi:hypothetical protein
MAECAVRGVPDDAGFATLAVVAICAGLAAVAAALMALAVKGAERVHVQINYEVGQLALRSALDETVATLLEEPSVSTTRSFVHGYGGNTVTVRLANEAGKVNFNQADRADLEAALRAISASRAIELADTILDQRSRAGSQPIGMSALLESMEVSKETQACLRDRLTAHSSPADPLLAGGDSRTWAGAIINLRAMLGSPGDANRGREAIVVLTGDPTAPAIWLEEREFLERSSEECALEAS